MSTDYYLYSPSKKRAVMIGSIGMGGAKTWPVEYGGRAFIKWMIEEMIDDVVVVNEHQIDEDVETGNYIGRGQMHSDIEKHNP